MSGGETLDFSFRPKGPFDLENQSQYFGGWLSPEGRPDAIAMAFPVEGWTDSCAVILSQDTEGVIQGMVHGAGDRSAKAKDQALACLSLDVSGEQWPRLAGSDPVIGRMQDKYHYLRPVLFHSPYEAAAGFIIGQRISIKQRQAIMKRMAKDLGGKIAVHGEDHFAFPLPQELLKLHTYAGVSQEKIDRLHGVAQAALDGMLDRNTLRAQSIEDALAELQTLRGIGPFFAEGILFRGAGIVDEVTNDSLTPYAVQQAYELKDLPGRDQLEEIASRWVPYRMWATVLLHVWLRREKGLPKK